MEIQPIETRYAGHRFRSRLEARWAVFFDRVGIAWEYEPEGYLVGPNRKPYLPDFWLPEQGVWVEVKGTEELLDVELVVHAALPSGGLPRAPKPHTISEYEVRLLILGSLGRGVQRVRSQKTGQWNGFVQPVHSTLAFRKGDLVQSFAVFRDETLRVAHPFAVIADDSPEINWAGQGCEWGNLVRGETVFVDPDDYDVKVANAYKAAIGARFEHGRSGD